jgi:arylsulfatase A-like enzyme
LPCSTSNTSRRHFLKSIGLTGLALSAGCVGAKIKRPNILLIMSDDHAQKAISAYDNQLIHTPNIDRLANEGAIFENSFVCNSICAPSRAVMLTGKHSHANGQVDNSVTFNGQQQTFPKLLQKAGYNTALIGKWHLRSDPTGFDYWNILTGQGHYYGPDFIEMGETKRYNGYVTDITTDFAIAWLNKKRDKNKPFCLLLHHKAPHRTWMPNIKDLEEYLNKEFEIPQNFFDDYADRIAAQNQHQSVRNDDMDFVYDLKMQDSTITTSRPQLGRHSQSFLERMDKETLKIWQQYYLPIIDKFKEEKLAGKELEIWKLQRYLQDYLATVKSVDDNVGRVLDYLDEKGFDENTVVVYTSDQGFYLGEHGWYDKRFMYEESMRTPLLMRFPKEIKPGTKIKHLVQNIDYAPTFCELAGVEEQEPFHGKSLSKTWRDDKSIHDALYYHYYEYPNEHMVNKHYGIRTDRYKLIKFYGDVDTWELYDLENDPTEMNNIYGGADGALIDSLKQQLKQLQNKYNDNVSEL